MQGFSRHFVNPPSFFVIPYNYYSKIFLFCIVSFGSQFSLFWLFPRFYPQKRGFIPLATNRLPLKTAVSLAASGVQRFLFYLVAIFRLLATNPIRFSSVFAGLWLFFLGSYTIASKKLLKKPRKQP
ncbi:MAG: hypothetical protein RR295_05190, partial [Oscillospiraceae bacterium]